MLRSILIGLVAGSRSMTPLALVSDAARHGALPANAIAPLLNHPLVSIGSKMLAAGEMAGDKWRSAPDRIVPAGMAARLVTAGIAGAALAPRGRLVLGAALGATAAVGAAYLTFHFRMRAMRRYGQTPSGVVEDAITLGVGKLVVSGAGRGR